LLRKRTALAENTVHQPSDPDGQVPLQPTGERSHGNPQSQLAERAVIAKPQQKPTDTPNTCSASFAIRVQYRGMERTHELPLTLHTMAQLALEAAIREVTIGELIAKLIMATVNEDVFPLLLDNTDSERLKPGPRN
jgi:hypothetical protein